jgi:hypothetical protein
MCVAVVTAVERTLCLVLRLCCVSGVIVAASLRAASQFVCVCVQDKRFGEWLRSLVSVCSSRCACACVSLCVVIIALESVTAVVLVVSGQRCQCPLCIRMCVVPDRAVASLPRDWCQLLSRCCTALVRTVGVRSTSMIMTYWLCGRMYCVWCVCSASVLAQCVLEICVAVAAVEAEICSCRMSRHAKLCVRCHRAASLRLRARYCASRLWARLCLYIPLVAQWLVLSCMCYLSVAPAL